MYYFDIVVIVGYYKEWGIWGEGLGNFFIYGDLFMILMDDFDFFLFLWGVIFGWDLSKVYDFDLDDFFEI